MGGEVAEGGGFGEEVGVAAVEFDGADFGFDVVFAKGLVEKEEAELGVEFMLFGGVIIEEEEDANFIIGGKHEVVDVIGADHVVVIDADIEDFAVAGAEFDPLPAAEERGGID